MITLDRTPPPPLRRYIIYGRPLIYFSYAANDDGRVGVYVTANPLTPENSYYEVEILDTGMLGAIGL